MSGRIPERFIDDLMTRVDIVDLVGQYVSLKKSGGEYAAKCPFHDDSTPSFTVTPSTQLYYCFGCHAGGTALDFVMQHERVEFVDAIESLAGHLGLEVPREAGGRGDDAGIDRLYAAVATADQFYRNALRDAPEAIEYLRGRGVTGHTAKRFGIGYAPGDGRAVLERANAGETPDLERAGLIASNERGHYDRFRNRVMFPIRDRRGRTFAFGGRVLEDDAKPKYLNSPETPIFDKSSVLYGIYEARQARGTDLDHLAVVEGYMDVIMLAQHGVDYAVATLGTSMTARQVELMFAAAPEITLCFDGDEAGRKAAWKAVAAILPNLRDGREARFLFLPDGEDPDSIVCSEGRDGFEARLRDAGTLADFLVERLQANHDTSSPGGSAQLVQEATGYLETMPEGVYHELLVERIASRIGLDPSRLRSGMALKNRADTSRRPPPRTDRSGGERLKYTYTSMRLAISLLLQRTSLAQRVSADHPALAADQGGAEVLRDFHAAITADPDITTARLMERWRDTPAGKQLHQLLGRPLEFDEEGAAEAQFDSAIAKIAENARADRYRELVEIRHERTLTEEEKNELRALITQPASRDASAGPAPR